MRKGGHRGSTLAHVRQNRRFLHITVRESQALVQRPPSLLSLPSPSSPAPADGGRGQHAMRTSEVWPSLEGQGMLESSKLPWRGHKGHAMGYQCSLNNCIDVHVVHAMDVPKPRHVLQCKLEPKPLTVINAD